MKEVKLGPAIVTSLRNTTVAIAVATMAERQHRRERHGRRAASSAGRSQAPPIGSMIALPASITPAAATSGSAGGRWRATMALMA